MLHSKIAIKSKPYILCSKIEVDITKIVVPARFYLGAIPKITLGYTQTLLNLSDAVFCHKSIIFCHNITSSSGLVIGHTGHFPGGPTH